MSLRDLTVEELLDRVAADGPPAGGAVAALTVASAAALVAMAARRSPSMPQASSHADQADALRTQAVDLADTDVGAYARVLRIRRDADGDGDRRARVATALRAATEVPLEIIGCALRVGEVAAQVATDGNARLREDATSAALLSDAAARAAATLVRANVASGDLSPELVRQAEEPYARLQATLRRLVAHPDSDL